MFQRLLRAALLGAALLAPGLAAAQGHGAPSAPPPATTDERPGLFINLTTDDIWSASMAVHFAHERALRGGHRPVTIWLSVRAIYLADRNRAPASNGPGQPDIHTMLRRFMADGGQVLACMGCARVAGLTQADMLDGVRIGTPEVLMPALMGPNVRTLSW